MTQITVAELQGLCNFAGQTARVGSALAEALAKPRTRLRFLARYASWNGLFGSAVAALAGKIGRSRGLFIDPAQELRALADRSVYVASYFFDAARDEFDDRDTVHRDSHRCLAQAMLKAMIGYERERGTVVDAAELNALFDEPLWLRALNDRVAIGYGAGTPDDLARVFASIGYHLGSELLADREFSIIDSSLRELAPELVAYLDRTQVEIAGQTHRAYQWIAIHSGHGGGAEADHFDWATQGARLAFRFVPEAHHRDLRRQLHLGFQDFARDHLEFFGQVNLPTLT